MSDWSDWVDEWLGSCECHACLDARSRTAFADGPVADTAETVTPQAGIVGAEPDRDDGDAVRHVCNDRRR